jgi:hypothetical protein
VSPAALHRPARRRNCTTGDSEANRLPRRWGAPTPIEHFIDSIRTRRRLKADILQGHVSTCLEHLANITYRTGNQKLVFDGRLPRTSWCTARCGACAFTTPLRESLAVHVE